MIRLQSALAAALLVAAPFAARAADVPDDRLTPGAIASRDVSDICDRTGGSYSKRHRVWDRQRETAAKYGVPWNERRNFEDDDRIPVCLGGDNSSPQNHWMQPGWGAWNYHMKDVLETRACREVCAGRVDLVVAQSWFLGDWRVAYCHEVRHTTVAECFGAR